VTIEQKIVEFYDDELVAIRADDDRIYVSVRHLCDALGLDRRGQVRRIQRSEILEEGYKGGAIMSPPSATGRGGGRQKANLLRVDLVPLWLSGVDTKRVKDEIRPKLIQYQREAATVLWDAFQQGRLTSSVSFDELIQKDSPAVNAYKMALAVVELARHQVLLEARLDDHQERLEQIEATLGDSGQHITPDQAMQISQAVKTIAITLGKQTKRNEFGAVYGELYRKFGITSYKMLPVAKFEDAMTFLTEWFENVAGEMPF